MNYLVREYIPSPIVTLQTWIQAGKSDDEKYDRVDTAIAKVAETITWLYFCLLPRNASVGSVGGGTIFHPLWEDYEAPFDFTSAAAMERYLNRALLLLPKFKGSRDPAPSISLNGVDLQFCHSDINYDNFLIDPETLEISLIDADSISILPAPLFLESALLMNNPFSRAVWGQLGLSHSPDVRLLTSLSNMMMQSGDAHFGLDNDGQPQIEELISSDTYHFSVCPLPVDCSVPIMEIPEPDDRKRTWPKARNPV
ncbi:hypothetical protein H0H92_010140 [Tricholoma furcatifolium]|nr:hypothetical protein H0H92_010140 [Tricholoma furcatifolium]